MDFGRFSYGFWITSEKKHALQIDRVCSHDCIFSRTPQTYGPAECAKRLNPPPPLVGDHGVSEHTSILKSHAKFFPNLQVLEPPIVPHWPRAFRQADPKFRLGTPLALPRRHFSDFSATFCRSKFHPKSDSSKGSQKTQKISKGSISHPFWNPFWHPFPFIFNTFCKSRKS